MDGCLQAVLDEYAHVLVESEGLQDADVHQRAGTLSETMTEALSTRTATNAVEDVRVVDGEISPGGSTDQQPLRCALRPSAVH